MTSLLCANPVLIALELGLSPDASWGSYREVIDGFITSTANRLPPDAQKLASSTTSTSSTLSGPPRPNEKEWWLHALPHVMQSRRGICRIFVTSPTFVAQLLEVLLKESVRASQFGEACRRHFCFIVEGICCTWDHSNDDMATAFGPLVTTAQVTMDYIDGAQRALAIAACLVFSGIAAPSVLMPSIRRRLQEIGKSEETLTADVAAMLCVALHDGLAGAIRKEEQSHPNSDMSNHEPLDSARPSAWTTLKKRDSTPRVSSSRSPRLAASLAESREGSPSGDYVLVAKDPTLSIPFPDKPPANVTVPSAVVMSCMILSSATLTVQSALRLGQWCLQALHALPLTITACALTQLVIKFPKAFRVSSSQDKSVRFCDAVIIHCCRIVGTLFERRLQHGVHGSLTNASTGIRDDMDEAVNSIDVMPCFLLLCLQAIQCSSGLRLSADAQHQLGKLFVHSSRLYVSHHSFAEEESAKAKAFAQPQPSARRGASVDPHKLRNTPSEVVSQVFRATLRAVDMVLHDYEAGTPETLRQVIIQTAPPHGALTNRIQEYGGCIRHQDLMETILAVCDPQLDERMRAADGHLSGAPSKAGAAATSRFSLIGWLPCSSEPLVFAGFPFSSDGGLTAKQKAWVMKRMVDYFRREWFLARVGVQTAQVTRIPLGGDGGSSGSDAGATRETFFDCFPRMAL